VRRYILGFLFDIQNTYWILLTIIVMCDLYGLTKTIKDRIIGTLIGATIAVGIVLLTQVSQLFMLSPLAFCFISIRVCVDSAKL
jgi:uncharacterized membrane protein YccC